MSEQSQPRPATEREIADQNIRRESRRAMAALWLERLARALWPGFAVIAALGGLVLLGVLTELPPLMRLAILAGGLFAALFFTVRGAFRLRRPRAPEALARLDEGVHGRPAQSYSDALATTAPESGTAALWAEHQRRLALCASSLRERGPRPDLARHDRFALRLCALVTLAAGLIGWGASEPGTVSFDDLFSPPGAAATPDIRPALEAWAEPPAYTGAEPVYLTRISGAEPVSLPEGTEITMRAFGVEGAPALSESVSGGASGFEAEDETIHSASFTVASDGEITVTGDGAELGRWRIAVIADEPPSADFTETPGEGARGALSAPWRAKDDYGVVSGELIIRADDEAAQAQSPYGPPRPVERLHLDVPLPWGADAREAEGVLVSDQTGHPLAGAPVIYTLIMRDAAGQEARAEVSGVMPRRYFTHPMAKALAEQSRLVLRYEAGAPRAWDVLAAVTMHPEETFDDDIAYLAARVGVHRLASSIESGADDEALSAADILWRAALRLEDGDLASAAERLARAEERLREAMERGAPDEEIARLMEELRRAIQDYLAEMMRNSLRDQARGQPQEQQQGEGQSLTMEDLERMLRELEEALARGDMEAAQQMLQALAQMMQNLQAGQPGQGQGQGGQGDGLSGQLGDMIGEQQGLADDTFGAMRGGEGAGQGEGGGQGQGENGAGAQRALRDALNGLMGELPGGAGEETRRALEGAGEAMDDAARNLERGDESAALDDQIRALEALREGQRSLGRDMAQGGQGSGPGGRGDDPLGRPGATYGSIEEGGDIPGGISPKKRARELREEIRRRAGERARPEEELDYLNRLLERF